MMSSDEEENVDILALITGHGSAPKKTPVTPITRSLSASSDEEDFGLVLPPVFQTDGVKNDILAKRNRDLAQQIESEKDKIDLEYNDLLHRQHQILQMLNDNGSLGQIVFLLETHRDLINGLVKQVIRGVEPKTHFYFYGTTKLVPVGDLSATELARELVKGSETYQHEEILQNNEYLKNRGGFNNVPVDARLAINSTDPVVVLTILRHLEKHQTIAGAGFDLCKFKKLLSAIGGSVSNPVGQKVVYYNPQAHLTVLKASILMHLVCLQNFESTLMNWALEWAILSLADFFIIKNNFVEYVRHFLPALERFLLWSGSAMGIDSATNILERILTNTDIEIASNFLQITFRYHFKDNSNTMGYRMLLTAIERFTLRGTFEDLSVTDRTIEKTDDHEFFKAVSKLLETDLDICKDIKHRILLLPLLVTSSHQQLLPVFSKCRNFAHQRLGELSNGSIKLRDKNAALEDVSCIYDTLDFLVQKIERQAPPVDLFYHEQEPV